MSSMLLSSLKAHEIMQDNASSNIANMNTPGYRALRTSFTLSLDGSVDVTTIRSDDPAPLKWREPCSQVWILPENLST